MKHRVRLLGVVLLAVLLVAANVWLLALDRSRTATGAAKAGAVATARQWSANLINVDPAHAHESYVQLRQGATAPLADQLNGRTKTFVAAIQQAGVVSTGTVKEAGVSAFGGDTASVLLVASSTVRNGQVPDGEQRQYRMALTLRAEGDRWLVSKLDFVP